MSGFFSESVLKSSRTKAPVGRVPLCGSCGLFKTCLTPKMTAQGKGSGKVLVVLPPHSGSDDTSGRLLSGEAGKYTASLLKRAIGPVGMSRVVKFAPVLACHRSRKPRPDDAAKCRPMLNRIIKETNPEIIVAIGPDAAASVTAIYGGPEKNIMKTVGYQIPCRAGNCWILTANNPAYFMGRKDREVQESFFLEALSVIGPKMRRPYAVDVDHTKEVLRVTSPTTAAKLIRRGMERTRVAAAFDYETNMLKPEHELAHIVSGAVCFDGKKTLAYPMIGEAITATKELMVSDIPLIAANLKFEDRWTKTILGVRPRRWVWDTMLAAHALDNRTGVTGLKFQAWSAMGLAPWADHIAPFLEKDNPDGTNNIHEIDMQDLLLYNGLDALYEYMLAMVQIKAMGYPMERVRR